MKQLLTILNISSVKSEFLDQKFQIQFNQYCYNLTKEQYRIANSIELLKGIITTGKENCKELRQADQLVLAQQVAPTQRDQEILKYGNWCGPGYGGLSDYPKMGCKEICYQNRKEPSKECLQCLPAIDYVDQLCLQHDFCWLRAEDAKTNQNVCTKTQWGLGKEYGYPCTCQIPIVTGTEVAKLMQKCNGLKCILTGGIIHSVFSNEFIKCACDINGNQECLEPYDCVTKGGK